ncbi:MAG: hypothetical protein ACRD3J_26080, partial [Thermoanaerobaculia bacterium]
AGLPEEVITTTIDSSAHRALDASPKGLIQLSDAKASPALLRHVQEIAAKGSAPSKRKKGS